MLEKSNIEHCSWWPDGGATRLVYVKTGKVVGRVEADLRTLDPEWLAKFTDTRGEFECFGRFLSRDHAVVALEAEACVRLGLEPRG